MKNRQRVAANSPVVLGSLASDLNGAIRRLTEILVAALADHWDSLVGADAASTTKSLFDLWCRQSLMASPGQAAELVASHLTGQPGDAAGVAAILRSQCEVPADEADRASNRLVSTWAVSPAVEGLRPVVWDAYRSQREKFCAQTAHVLVARVLLYRVGEDKGLFPERVSGQTWTSERQKGRALAWTFGWVFALLEQVRASMRSLVPSV